MTDPLTSDLAALPSVGDELPPGTALCQGQYTVVRYLNSGGFGVTYLAHDSLGRKVVIKECYPGAMCCRTQKTVRLRSISHETDFDRVVALFEREARALAHLSHPNIVGVHQIFEDNGTAYMAMDFIEGPDLFDLLESDPDRFEPAEVVRIVKHLLGALSYVHDNGMLHRDISPDNILLAPGGLPVLIDFGAAREDAARATRVLSRIHTVKDGYSPQEFYLAGSAQEKSSDLYALAATAHHLIRGHAPPNSNIRLAAVAQDQPDPYVPLSGTVPGYDPAFLAALDQSLRLFARDRIKTADDWLAMISGKAAPGRAAALDDDMHLKISQLVSETDSFLEDAPGDPREERAAREAIPDPLAAQRAAERAYWAEVNDELEAIRKDIEREEAMKRQQAQEEARRLAEAEAQLGGLGDARTARGGRFTGWVKDLFVSRKSAGKDTPLQPMED
ncbi:protein kinase domain-containing protein [Pacificoceanicola onchidii]|uniref:protein kinase domain-containing protein n=1 Tax=Pacificoceanicola onchidii TaxID=2562685 RepID=UPI0010A49CD1|nr:protein kinase [Pacificoceanicola onchidii]